MKSNITLFYIYIFVTLVFLMPVCYLITKDLFRVLSFFYYRYSIYYYDFLDMSQDKLNKKIDFYLFKKQWFVCISMLEFFYENKIFTNFVVLLYLGYCYENLFYFHIAEYYYLKSLSFSKNNLLILNKLANLYKLSKQNIKELKILKQISLLQDNFF
uniref:Uncharacterized protein n=1 Tax=Dictyurus purpurascens TaxID=189649 RepID=A0A4D6WUM6_9FLOR|nr:hypothetical protein [Dictyurus purpurascens]